MILTDESSLLDFWASKLLTTEFIASHSIGFHDTVTVSLHIFDLHLLPYLHILTCCKFTILER